MAQELNIANTSKIRNSIFILIGIMMSLFIAYTDEGNHSLNINNLNTWLGFVAFSSIIFLCQYIVFRVILKKYNKTGKIPLSVVGGIILFACAIFAYAGLIILVKS